MILVHSITAALRFQLTLCNLKYQPHKTLHVFAFSTAFKIRSNSTLFPVLFSAESKGGYLTKNPGAGCEICQELGGKNATCLGHGWFELEMYVQLLTILKIFNFFPKNRSCY